MIAPFDSRLSIVANASYFWSVFDQTNPAHILPDGCLQTPGAVVDDACCDGPIIMQLSDLSTSSCFVISGLSEDGTSFRAYAGCEGTTAVYGEGCYEGGFIPAGVDLTELTLNTTVAECGCGFRITSGTGCYKANDAGTQIFFVNLNDDVCTEETPTGGEDVTGADELTLDDAASDSTSATVSSAMFHKMTPSAAYSLVAFGLAYAGF